LVVDVAGGNLKTDQAEAPVPVRVLLTAGHWLIVAALLLLLQSFFRLEAVGTAAQLLVAGLAIVAFLRPSTALLVAAALLPIAGPLMHFAGAGRALGPEALALAFLAGWLAREGLRFGAERRLPEHLAVPILLFGAVIVASATVCLAVFQVHQHHPWPFLNSLWITVSGAYLEQRHPLLEPLYAAALLLEGMALLAAVVLLVRREPGLATRLVHMVIVGAAAAGALSCVQYGMDWFSGAEVPALHNVGRMGSRLSVHSPDLNAAGSHFAMAILMVLGVGVAARRRAWIVAPILLVAAGLWLSGSRTAIIALPAGIAAAFLLPKLPRGMAGVGWGAGAIALLVGSVYALSRMLGDLAILAMDIRIMFLEMSLRIWGTAPVWGVGIGRYYEVSGQFMPEALSAASPHENAHNYFLQMGAELGIVGLALFVWLLAAAIGGSALRGWKVRNGTETGLLAGTLAFLVSCLGGHPLLVPPVAYSFWMTLGILACIAHQGNREAVTERQARGWWSRRWKSRETIAALLAVAVVASTPLRVRSEVARLDFSHIRYGFSPWHFDEEHQLYYKFLYRSGTFFVSADAVSLEIPLRAAPSGQASAPPEIEISVDGVLLSRLVVPDDYWMRHRLTMPSGRRTVRFSRMDLRQVGDFASGTEGGPLLMVGEWIVRGEKEPRDNEP
jgi:hypothetical protein